MSDLKPTGIPVMVDGVERHFLFTLNAIDMLQEMYDEPIENIVDHITEKRAATAALKKIVCVLLADEKERNPDKGYKDYTEQDIGWMITQENVLDYTIKVLAAYGVSLPKGEDESPNRESGSMKE